jgi:NADH-quinone oxidoreductase subunit C
MTPELLQRLRERLGGALLTLEEFRGDAVVTVPKNEIVRVCTMLRDDTVLAFAMLIDLFGIDMYRPEGRFEVEYNLYSLVNRCYLRVKVRTEEDDPVVPSVTGVWLGANWHERETFDMFGIRFEGHPDLRRLYMPEEFEYHPLRKDFPLMGIPDSMPLPRR